MTTFRCNELVDLFEDDCQEVRTGALTLLCDSYANELEILPAILQAWDRFGVEKAFADLPLLSYLPAQAALLPDVCERAARMVTGRGLTDPQTRAAGKLIEQQLQLSAVELLPHMELLRATVHRSKIFFRVDLALQAERMELLGLTADQIAVHLDGAIAACLANPKHDAARSKAVISLEALRRQHPHYLDLSVALSGPPQEGGPAWLSFCITLQSLIQLSQVGLEDHIGRHLLDHREFVYSLAVEAIVRCGTRAAAEQLLTNFPDANARAQHWIARGLQRVRFPGLAARIAELQTDDAHLKNSLFIAQLKQLDVGQTDFARQLQQQTSPPTECGALLQLNQRMWPKSDKLVQAELERLLKKTTELDPAQNAASAQKRAAIRAALRQQVRKID